MISRVTAVFSCKTQRNGQLRLRFFVLASLLFLTAAGFSSAEDVSAGIRGTVNDTEGAHIEGATVIVNNQETGAVFCTRTGSNGSYELLKLPVGTYSLTVRASGFQTFTVFGIKLQSSSMFTREIEMLTGKMTDNILVPANHMGGATRSAQLSLIRLRRC